MREIESLDRRIVKFDENLCESFLKGRWFYQITLDDDDDYEDDEDEELEKEENDKKDKKSRRWHLF